MTLRNFVFPLLILSLTYNPAAADYHTSVSVFQNNNYKGKSVQGYALKNGPLDLKKHKLENSVSSFYIGNGSCVELHTKCAPSYGNISNWFYATGYHHHYHLGNEYYEERINCFAECKVETKWLKCPKGYFVRRMSWDKSKQFRNGIELLCVSAKSNKLKAVVRSHGSGKLPEYSECPKSALRSFNLIKSTRAEVVVSLLHHSCEPNAKKFEYSKQEGKEYIWDLYYGYTSNCKPGMAMMGAQVDIEKNSNYVKHMGIMCDKIPNPLAECEATDRFVTVFACDGSQSLFEFECSGTQIFGIEQKNLTSDAEKWQKEFSYGFNGELGISYKPMEAKFKTGVEIGSTTGFEWTKASERLFFEIQSTSVTVKVDPGCITSVVQIVGECAFAEVRVNKFSRKDECKSGVVATRREPIYTKEGGWVL